MHQSLTDFVLMRWAERRNVLLQLNVHLCCVWRYFSNSRGMFWGLDFFLLGFKNGSLAVVW